MDNLSFNWGNYRVQAALRPLMTHEYYPFSRTVKGRNYSIWRLFATSSGSSSSSSSIELKSIGFFDSKKKWPSNRNTNTFFYCKFNKIFMFRFDFQLPDSLGLLCFVKEFPFPFPIRFKCLCAWCSHWNWLLSLPFCHHTSCECSEKWFPFSAKRN